MKAHNFSLLDQNGSIHTLDDYKGRWLVLYFYPKDDTPGCTKEACGFRDNIKILIDHNIAVLGVSKDSVVSHKTFSEKYNLPFPLLSDESAEVIKAYNAWGTKVFMGLYDGVLRKTYLINPDGEIAKVYEKVKPEQHAEEILHEVQTQQKHA